MAGSRVTLGSDSIPKWAILLGGFVLAGLLGVVDYYTGHELVVSALYVLPIGLVAWYARPTLGLWVAVISAAIWLTVDIADGDHAGAVILGLNTGILLGLFCIIVYVLGALHRAIRHLQQMSRFDSLTGAYNSGYLYDLLSQELERLRRYGHPLTLAYLDLDGFKAVNDDSGHLVGDQVLRLVADSAKSRLRKTDVVARMGGDEFAFLCPETDEAAARAMIAEVMKRLDEEMRKGGWPVTFSVGVVTCNQVPPSSEHLVKTADDLMYSVKLGAKNGIKYASLGQPRPRGAQDEEREPAQALRG